MLRAMAHAVVIGGLLIGAAHAFSAGSWLIPIALASLAVFVLEIWLAEQPTKFVCWRCGADNPQLCDCWVRCWCDAMHPKGERCSNPLHDVKGEMQ